MENSMLSEIPFSPGGETFIVDKTKLVQYLF